MVLGRWQRGTGRAAGGAQPNEGTPVSVLDKKCWYLLFGVSGRVSVGQLITDRGGMLEDSRGDKGAGGHVLWGGKGCTGWGAGRPLQNPGSHLRPQLAAANETLGLEMRNLGMVRFWGCLMAGCCGLGGSRMSGARRAGGDLQLWGASASPPPPAAGAELPRICSPDFEALHRSKPGGHLSSRLTWALCAPSPGRGGIWRQCWQLEAAG